MTTKKRVIAIVEVGKDYTDKLRTIEVEDCSLEEAQRMVKGAGYQIIDDLCTIVHTIDEIHIIVTVEPEGEEEEE